MFPKLDSNSFAFASFNMIKIIPLRKRLKDYTSAPDSPSG